MTKDTRRYPADSGRLKQAFNDESNTPDRNDGEEALEKRRPWKEESRRGHRQSHKQRQRNPEWNG